MKRIPLRARDGSVRAYATVDDGDYEWLSQWPWHLRDGYAVRTVYLGRGRMTTEAMHALVAGGRGPDHRNGDKLDNRRENLRLITHAQNAQNYRRRMSTVTGVRGVTRARGGQYMARVMLDGRSHYLGLHATVAQAAAVVRAFRSEHMPFSEEDHT